MAYVCDKVWWCNDLAEREDGKDTLIRLRQIEDAARPLPDWAASIAEENITYFPPCGHEMFGHNVNAILEAIENHRNVEGFFHCFMVSDDALRKSRDVVARCSANESCAGYSSLLAARLRNWAAVSSEVDGNPFTADGVRQDYHDWDEETKRTMVCEGLSPDDEVVEKIKNTWLCAPKTFRFIEKIGDEIGIDLHGFDTFDKDAFRQLILDSLLKIETAASVVEEHNDHVSFFLLSLLKAKLGEYTQNGMLKKVFRT